ncbi:hypothetical protein HAX54_033838, partial [Datura stramonium]|nr:hypothetical protein [Datura stramonium]
CQPMKYRCGATLNQNIWGKVNCEPPVKRRWRCAKHNSHAENWEKMYSLALGTVFRM